MPSAARHLRLLFAPLRVYFRLRGDSLGTMFVAQVAVIWVTIILPLKAAPMTRGAMIFFAFAICLTSITLGQQVTLQPLKPIGVPWRGDGWHWMSFVAFNGNGDEVASDGITVSPRGVSSQLSFWAFPGGRFIRKLPVQPTAVSPDFKFYATSHSMGEVDTGRTLLSLGKNKFANFAFSPDDHYVAESVWSKVSSRPKIRVLELPGLAPVSAFGRSSGQSLAFSPDGPRSHPAIGMR